ncbi:MAG: DUF1295 domain-containing protein [bacterium]|nr:DUF1295 domain-containing protein [bacterium]
MGLDTFVKVWIGLSLPAFIALLFFRAPYGRFFRPGWGPALSDRVGWLVMELPAVLVFLALLLGSGATPGPVALVFAGMWLGHYVHRSLVHPFLRRGNARRVPLLLALFGVVFNAINATLNGSHLFAGGAPYDTAWFADARFLSGAALFGVGLAINVRSDRELCRLRRADEAGYGVPVGGLHRFVSCPNYLGEILEWGGWALATWSLAGLSFALWTAANLVPRALAYHAWYRRRFPDYPTDRRALVPFLL